MRICSIYKEGDLFPEIGWLVVIPVEGRFFLEAFEMLYTSKLVL